MSLTLKKYMFFSKSRLPLLGNKTAKDGKTNMINGQVEKRFSRWLRVIC